MREGDSAKATPAAPAIPSRPKSVSECPAMKAIKDRDIDRAVKVMGEVMSTGKASDRLGRPSCYSIVLLALQSRWI